MSLWDSHTTVELLQTCQTPSQCNICEKIRSDDQEDGEKYEPFTSQNPWYRAQYSDIDICSECYPTFYDNLVNTNENGRYKYCDVCIQDIGEKPYYYTNEDAGYDVCAACYASKRPFGVNINQTGIQTGRNKYIIAKHITYDYIPQNLLSEITAERNKLFIDLLDSLVDTFNNILEWTLITDLTACEHRDSECGFAVNVIDPKHPVASILSDNHGRVSMNVVYDTYEDYLREKEEYINMNESVCSRSSVSSDSSSSSNKISFAEYIRNIRFYYG
jgi:hypothetical protein